MRRTDVAATKAPTRAVVAKSGLALEVITALVKTATLAVALLAARAATEPIGLAPPLVLRAGLPIQAYPRRRLPDPRRPERRADGDRRGRRYGSRTGADENDRRHESTPRRVESDHEGHRRQEWFRRHGDGVSPHGQLQSVRRPHRSASNDRSTAPHLRKSSPLHATTARAARLQCSGWRQEALRSIEAVAHILKY